MSADDSNQATFTNLVGSSEVFHWIIKTTAKIESWAVEHATTGHSLIIQIGSEFFSWVVDRITEISKAVSCIFDLVSLANSLTSSSSNSIKKIFRTRPSQSVYHQGRPCFRVYAYLITLSNTVED